MNVPPFWLRAFYSVLLTALFYISIPNVMVGDILRQCALVFFASFLLQYTVFDRIVRGFKDALARSMFTFWVMLTAVTIGIEVLYVVRHLNWLEEARTGYENLVGLYAGYTVASIVFTTMACAHQAFVLKTARDA